MKEHQALLVEDDPEMAEELSLVLSSLDCVATKVNNRHDALEHLQSTVFCLVVLDLQIKNEAQNMKSSDVSGRNLLREIRRRHPQRVGLFWRLPVVVVSAHLQDLELAVDVMRDGASHAVQKGLSRNGVEKAVRDVLSESSRATHDLCSKAFLAARVTGESLQLSIPGDVRKRRARVTLGSAESALPDASLLALLKLIRAKLKRSSVDTSDLGGAGPAYRLISNLKEAFRAALGPDDKLIENDYDGTYRLADNIEIGACDLEKLKTRRDARIAEVAADIVRLRGERKR